MSEDKSTSKSKAAIWVAVITGIFALCGTIITVVGSPIIQQWLQSRPTPTQVVVVATPNTPTATPILPTNTPTRRPQAVTQTPTAVPLVHILATRLDVFEGPGYVYDRIGQLEAGEHLTPVGRSWGEVQGNWIQILLPSGGVGWIQDDPDRVARNFPLDDLPFGVISPTPEPAAPQQISPARLGEVNSPATSPAGVTWDGSHLWQVNRSENGWLYKLDSKGVILRQWPLAGPFSDGLTFDGQHLWYAETNVSRVFRLDPDTGQVLQQFHTPGWGNIDDLAWDGEFLWVASFQPYRLYKVDPATGEEVESFPGPIPPGYSDSIPDFEGENDTSLRISGLTWDGLFLWVSETSTGTIMKVNPYTGAIVSYFTDDLRFPWGLAWDGTNLWVSDGASRTIIKYQP